MDFRLIVLGERAEVKVGEKSLGEHCVQDYGLIWRDVIGFWKVGAEYRLPDGNWVRISEDEVSRFFMRWEG